jgi:cephalosporin-C deacetylase
MTPLAKFLLFGLALLLAPADWAQAGVEVLPVAQDAHAPLTIESDRADRLYALGSRARLHIAVKRTPYPNEGVPVRLRLGPDMLEGAEREVRVPAEGLTLTLESPAQPGFVRAIVQATLDGQPLQAIATVGFAPEQIVPTQTDPADFDAFWAQQKAELDQIPPDLQLVPAPALSNERIEVFWLSFQNVGNWAGPSRIHGVLARPRGAGPFPALLNVPGAGVRPYSGNLAMAERGFITLQLGVHGVPVNLPKPLYDDLERGALGSYPRYEIDDPRRYYYRRVYLGVHRAVDVLANLPQWNGRQLLVSGGSQGGQLAIVAAVLNPRVTGVAANYPAYSDVSGYLHGRAGGWPGLFRPGPDGQAQDLPVAPKLRTSSYYDSVNFARRLKVPGHYSWGFNDTPPTSLHAAFNVIPAPKRLLLAPDQAHAVSPAQSARISAWLIDQVRHAAPITAP